MHEELDNEDYFDKIERELLDEVNDEKAKDSQRKSNAQSSSEGVSSKNVFIWLLRFWILLCPANFL